MLYPELRGRLEKYFSEEELNDVDKAYEYAKQAHEGQTRNSGEPYITHSVAVAKMLAKLVGGEKMQKLKNNHNIIIQIGNCCYSTIKEGI